jgi:predicted dehydrogenase
MSRRTNRRRFLQESAVAGLGFWAAGGVALSREGKSANDKVNIACIGVGGKGSSDVDGAAKNGQIVALCDVDDEFLAKKAEKHPDAQKFADYREMLDKLGDKIDAVTVSTPDHTHAPASLMAMKLGKGVYCQKPLTHTVAEAREMRDTAAKMKVATQMGNQGSAENGLREAVEIIQAGAIGPVHEVHVWTNRPIWPQAPKIMAMPKDEQPIPSKLHWNLWLGVAPTRPYHDGYHPFSWRGWLDFGTGAIGDMACHTANLAYRALKLGLPASVVAEAGDVNPETWPAWAQIVFQFPAREGLPEVKFTWYEGHKDGQKVLPPEKLVEIMKGTKDGLKDSGSLLVGDKGMLYSPDDYGAKYILLPEDDFKAYKKPEPTLPRNGRGDDGMKAEWVAGIQGGPAPYSNFEIASRLTESMLLGDVAIRVTGKKLEYDGEKGRITNNADGDKILKTDYRTGW